MPTSTKELTRPVTADQPATPTPEGRPATPVSPEDAALVDAAHGGDLVAFGQIYRKHFHRIFDFIARVTRDGRAAEELTRETFAIAVTGLTELSSQTGLPIRLYSIARELAVAHGTDETAPPVESGNDRGPVSLIWEGAGLLGSRTYAVVDLSVRQGLSDAEVGAAMGIRGDIAPETVARTRERAGQAVSIYALVKTRVARCEGLKGVVGAHARRSMGADLNDVVGAHVEGCDGCGRAWSGLSSPLEVLEELPAATPPTGLRDDIWSQIRRRYVWAGPGSKERRIAGFSAVASLLFALVIAVVAGTGPGRSADALTEASTGAATSRLLLQPGVPAGVASTTTTTVHVPDTTLVLTVSPPPEPVASTTTVAPSEPPIMSIITPVDGQRIDSSSQHGFVELVAVVQDDIDEGLVVAWHEGPTYFGSGNSITVALASGCPDPITHTITATVTDSSGETASDSVTLTIRCLNPEG